jgi:hypothetical protein
MTTSYADRFDLVENGQFRKRIQYAIWVAARGVLNDGSATAGQKDKARGLLRGVLDADVMRRVAIACVANPVVGGAGLNATDTDIQSVVDSGIAALLA